MTKQAHIVTALHEIGDKVLGLCGKEWKVKTKWADIPDDKPICRTCVDVALKALDEADAVLELARRRSTISLIQSGRLDEELNAEDLLLDRIAEDNAAHREKVERKIEEKVERKRVKQTCTCTWSKTEIERVDPKCPIHGDMAEPRAIEDTELPEGDQ